MDHSAHGHATASPAQPDAGHESTAHHQHQPHPPDHDQASGHDKHAGHDVEMFRSRFWLSLLLTIPVVLYSEMVQDWLNFSMPSFPGSGAIAPVLGTVVFLYGGRSS